MDEKNGLQGDSFSIYQLKEDGSTRHISFEGMDYLKRYGYSVDKDNYNEVYTAPLKPGTDLEDIFTQFNVDHPADFTGHSLSVSDIVVIHDGDEDKAFFVDRFGFEEVKEFLLERSMDQSMDAPELAFKIEDRFISIQETDGGYDYSIYDDGYHLLDGGVIDDPEISIREAAESVLEELKAPVYDERTDTFSYNDRLHGNIRMSSEAERMDYEDLMEKVEEVGVAEIADAQTSRDVVAEFREKTEAMFERDALGGFSPEEIEADVKARVQQIIDDYSIDAKIEDVIVAGSRCRGLEQSGSDLDVVVSFSGTEREDSFFNLLHEESLFFGSGIELDINPINTAETGTLEEYLPKAESFLEQKAEKIAQEAAKKLEAERTERELTREPEQTVTFTVAECGEFHSRGQFIEDIPTVEQAMTEFNRMTEESHLNGLPAIGINVHTEGTPEMDDMQWDFLTGNTLDLMGLSYMPEMAKNEEVLEALHTLAENYPDARVEGRFPDEVTQAEIISFQERKEAMEQAAQRKDEDLDAVKPVFEAGSITLAAELDAFARDNDFHNYQNNVENPDAHIAELQKDLDSGNTDHIKQFLQETIDDDTALPEELARAKELLQKLAEYKPLAKVEEQVEENFNQIDNQLSNIPPDPEEKKEPRQEKTMRMEEHKKIRKRVSIKAKIAEKKAIIAAGEGGAPKKDKSNPQREV